MTIEPLAFAREACAGCDELAGRHPYVAIVNDGQGGWKSLPVCHACWLEPRHRKHPLKAHFFERAQEAVALREAGSTHIRG